MVPARAGFAHGQAEAEPRSRRRLRLRWSETAARNREAAERARQLFALHKRSHRARGASFDRLADRSLLAAYCEALADGGYAVAAATDGISCLNLLRDAAPDVAVLDRALPWGGGDGVLALMRQEPSYLRVPVIAFTTRADEALCTFMALPVEMYLPTPPTPQSLTTTVRTLLYRQRSSLRADTAAGHAMRPGRAHAGEPRDLPWTIQANRNHPADFS